LVALFLTHTVGPSPVGNLGTASTTPTPVASGGSSASKSVQNVPQVNPIGPAGNTSPSPSPSISTSPPGQVEISGVSFTGTSAAPTVTVSGAGFGANAPAGQLDNATTCGPYTSNGDVYGNNLWFIDNGNFAAGIGTPPKASCIGITIQSWSDSQVSYQFGNAYNSFDHWYITSGDQYTLAVDGVPYSGTVSFSA
jgi:hypothetical protein